MTTFNYLKGINPEIKKRYTEIEKMIMVASPSFYDALGNLMESYLSFVSVYYKIRVELGASHGKLTNTLRPLLIEMMGMDENVYNKIKQISGSINMHKHTQMRGIDSYTCTQNMKSFFDFYATISRDSNSMFDEVFDYQYYKSLYGILSQTSIIQLIMSFKSVSANSKDEYENLQGKIEKYKKLFNC